MTLCQCPVDQQVSQLPNVLFPVCSSVPPFCFKWRHFIWWQIVLYISWLEILFAPRYCRIIDLKQCVKFNYDGNHSRQENKCRWLVPGLNMETEITPNIDISLLSDYIGWGYEVYFIKDLPKPWLSLRYPHAESEHEL